MNMEPFEFTFIETTEEEFAKKIKEGGWIECYLNCPLQGCEKHRPHRHYICSDCGQADFINAEWCFECYMASETRRVRLKIHKAIRKYGYTLKKLGVFCFVVILFTVANWGGCK